MEHFYGQGFTIPDINGDFRDTITYLGMFEDFDEVEEVEESQKCSWIYSDESLQLLQNNIEETISKNSLNENKHMYFGLDRDDNSIHLIGTMVSIDEADEASDAIEADVSEIYSTKSLFNLKNEIEQAILTKTKFSEATE